MLGRVSTHGIVGLVWQYFGFKIHERIQVGLSFMKLDPQFKA